MKNLGGLGSSYLLNPIKQPVSSKKINQPLSFGVLADTVYFSGKDPKKSETDKRAEQKANKKTPHKKPPKKPNPWKMIAVPLVAIGLMQAVVHTGGEKKEAVVADGDAYALRKVDPNYGLPEAAKKTSGNLLKSVDEVVELSRGGYLLPFGYFVNYQGIPSYRFTTRTGKPLYLPYPKLGEDNQWMLQELKAKDNPNPVDVSMVPIKEKDPVSEAVVSILPTLMIFGLLAFMLRSAAGKSSLLGNEKNDSAAQPKTRFSDIGGYPEVVKQLQEVLEYIEYVREEPAAGAASESKSKEAIERSSRIQKIKQETSWPEPPSGILLTGPPGTGKTYMAKAIAGEAGIPILTKSGSDFVEIYVGNGSRKVKALFADARKLAAKHGACIVFIDEIDALGKARAGMGGRQSGGNDEREQTLNALLVEMDGFEKEGINNIIVIGATNQAGVLDPALVRSGRFDMKIEIPAPVTAEQREDILEKHCIAKGLEPMPGEDVNLMEIAQLTQGMVGADLEGVVKEAKRLRWQEVKAEAKGNPSEVGIRHFRDAIQNIVMGPRRDYKLPEKDRRTIAIHEVLGHGLVGDAVGIPPLVISMIARNKSLGHVIPDPQAMESILPGLDDKLKELLLTMGGQAAESVMMGSEKITAGAGMDYKQARSILKNMLNSGMFQGFNVSSYEYADQPLEKEDRVFMNSILSNALDTAIKIIEEVPEADRLKLVNASIKAGELQGKEAMMFYKNTLGPNFDWKPMEELTKSFIKNPLGKKSDEKA